MKNIKAFLISGRYYPASAWMHARAGFIRTILSRQCMDARQGWVYQDDIIPLVLYPGMAGAWMHAMAGFIRTILLYPGRRMGNNIV